ncbi:MAG: hypothetical protein GY799_13610 [Desulfobulbaceae bacterium]|nr:hypothetical protein [Desulfobulbaceae bacterium]
MTIKQLLRLTLIFLRIMIGLVVIKTGFDFASGSGAFAYQETDGLTGIFVIIIGLYFVFSSLFGRPFDQSD